MGPLEGDHSAKCWAKCFLGHKGLQPYGLNCSPWYVKCSTSLCNYRKLGMSADAVVEHELRDRLL